MRGFQILFFKFFTANEESHSGGMQTSMSMVWPRRESPSPPPGRRRQSAGDTLDGPRRSSPQRIPTSRKKINESLKVWPNFVQIEHFFVVKII